MNIKNRLNDFGQLVKQVLSGTGASFYRKQYDKMVVLAGKENPMFTAQNISDALETLAYNLQLPAITALEEQVHERLKQHEAAIASLVAEKDVLSGFPDWLMAMLTGNHITFQLPENNRRVLPEVVSWFVRENPEFKSQIAFTEGKIDKPDYLFTYPLEPSEKKHMMYFSRYSGVVRRKQKAVAVLNGEEDQTDLHALAEGVMKYFNQGSHRIAKIFVPQGYDFSPLLQSFSAYDELKNHNNYLNNYEYYKSIYLLNKENYLDNELVLLKEDNKAIRSPLSVIYFAYYNTEEELQEIGNHEDVSAVYGAGYYADFSFEKAKMPLFYEWEDYSALKGI